MMTKLSHERHPPLDTGKEENCVYIAKRLKVLIAVLPLGAIFLKGFWKTTAPATRKEVVPFVVLPSPPTTNKCHR